MQLKVASALRFAGRVSAPRGGVIVDHRSQRRCYRPRREPAASPARSLRGRRWCVGDASSGVSPDSTRGSWRDMVRGGACCGVGVTSLVRVLVQALAVVGRWRVVSARLWRVGRRFGEASVGVRSWLARRCWCDGRCVVGGVLCVCRGVVWGDFVRGGEQHRRGERDRQRLGNPSTVAITPLQP